MFVCKDVHYDALEAILGEKWGYSEGLHNGDRFRCHIGAFGIAIRFIKVRSTLYVWYFYERWMCKLGEWIPLQSIDIAIEAFDIAIKLSSGAIEIVQVDIGQCAGEPTSNGLRAWRSYKVLRWTT